MAVQATNLQFDYSKYGFRDAENYVYKSGKGLNEGVVRELSGMKGEPEWMLKRRLHALEIFRKKPVPLVGAWANSLSNRIAQTSDVRHPPPPSKKDALNFLWRRFAQSVPGSLTS